MTHFNLRSTLTSSCLVLSVALAAFGCSSSDGNSGLNDTGGVGAGGAGVIAGTGGTAFGTSGGSGGAHSAAGSAGQSAGGTASTAGASNGGSSGAGQSSGGASRGGASSGGTSNGGASSGGASSGGTSNGGASSGGRSGAGGTSSGGTPGLGAWVTGYAATMFGNSTMNDCAGYTNFTDSTNISGSTCVSNRSLTLDAFQTGVANNSSYYAAPGDLASIWQGPECMCQTRDGGGVGDCPNAPSCPMEQDCAKCVAVKCDPNGMFMDGGSTHVKDCSTTSYVVVEIIDACPHNHPTNVASAANGGPGWCTSKQANHIDLSCSALGDISTLGTGVGRDGWLNVDVQIVPCSLGLGKHAL